MMKIKVASLFFIAVTLICLPAVNLFAGDVDYNRDIRPILSETCFQCHGPDSDKREADLRLDIVEGALAKLDDHFAIVPGKPEQSAVVSRITSTDTDEIMPPADSGLKLTPAQIGLIRQWIKQGAKYDLHWSFKPIRNPQLPTVKQKGWVRNGIDAFVLKKLESKSIVPAPEADRATLIRRVTLDLTGLPPTLDELQTYLADGSKNAYEKMVDRVLKSRHYGEKWGRHWLDQARYADTDGYTIDAMRSMWPYRDWVIAALNNDQPFDQFTVDQIAGDLLEKPTREQLIATGFHRNTLINGEGGTDNEQFRNEAVVDRVSTTGAVWLGLTIGCAQCHNHKFDPISQREFYEMFAFFNSSQDVNTRNPQLTISTPAEQQQLEQFDKRIHAAKANLTAYTKQQNKKLPPKEQNDGKPVVWRVISKPLVESNAGAMFALQKDLSILVSGTNAAADEYIIRFSTDKIKQITAIKLESSR